MGVWFGSLVSCLSGAIIPANPFFRGGGVLPLRFVYIIYVQKIH